MAKLVLNDVATFVNDGSAVNLVNNNSDAIVTAMENTLSRDGTSPNQMNADIDLNSNDLLNVGSVSAEQLYLNGKLVTSTNLSNITVADLPGGISGYSLIGNGTTSSPSYQGFIPNIPTPPTRTWQSKLQEVVSALDCGADPNSTDNATAFTKIISVAQSGIPVHFPPGVYKSSIPLNFTSVAYLSADPGTRIRLTASASFVMQFDYTAGGSGFGHGGSATGFILDGAGFAPDGLSIKGVINGDFDNTRVTNVTVAGLHLHWAQLCSFPNYICSHNIELFTTTPVNGILADTASCSANFFPNMTVEGVSGSGVLGISLINSLFLGGTSEGNNIGLEFGAATGALVGSGNVVELMDLEVNPGGDVVIQSLGSSNSFYSLAAGFNSGPCLVNGNSSRNLFEAGSNNGVTFDANSHDNVVRNINLASSGATIGKLGINNQVNNVYNPFTGVRLVSTWPGYENIVSLAAAGTYTIDGLYDDFVSLQATGATLTVNGPAGAQYAGKAVDLQIFNVSGGAITTTWGSNIRHNGWVDPANGTNRSIRLRYDHNFDRWYPIAMMTVDVSN